MIVLDEIITFEFFRQMERLDIPIILERCNTYIIKKEVYIFVIYRLTYCPEIITFEFSEIRRYSDLR